MGIARWLVLGVVLAGCGTVSSSDFDGDGFPDSLDCRPEDPLSYFGAPDPWGDGVDSDCDGTDGLDHDGDGFASNASVESGARDCDDDSVVSHPGGAEIYNNALDEDCDGVVDVDADFDGRPAGEADCDDQDPDTWAGAPELLDGVDNDCDGDVDEGTRGGDDDGDGYCEGADYDADGAPDCRGAALPGDCDDADPDRSPDDLDGDGASTCAGDCDDEDPTRGPDRQEACDGVDTDCNGEPASFELDGDGDGYFACTGDCDDTDPALTPEDDDGDGFSRCEGDCDDADATLTPQDADGDLWSLCDGDCDDLDPTRRPGAFEVCDGVDNDCSGSAAGEEDLDADGDPTCTDCDDGDPDLHSLDLDGDTWSACEGDCNDAASGIHPLALDAFGDGLDGNCDGVDGLDLDGDGDASAAGGGPDCDDADPTLNADDADGDGDSTCGGDCDDGDPSLESLDADGDGVDTCGGDCDDHQAARRPGAVEVCDGLDNDCDGSAAGEQDADADGSPACLDCDDADPALHLRDQDGDGWTSCDGDCNDANPNIAPGGNDPWGDALDTNCDGADGIDGDGDGWGNPGSGGPDCDDTDPAIHPGDADGDGSNPCDGDCDDADPAVDGEDRDGDGWTTCLGDCNDLNPDVRPGAVEVCDLDDTDCDPATGPPGDGIDNDGDGSPVCADCNDLAPTVVPGGPELCDGLDSNCDGVVPPHGSAGEVDNDGDGYVECSPWVGAASLGGGDCQDFDPDVNPAEFDDCDGVDTNCNGVPDDAGDQDGDGACALDCDDADPTRFPGQWESADDAIDLDCDGSTATGVLSADWSWTVPAGDEGTYSLAIVGDMDGDGLNDLAVGRAPATGASAVYLLSGATLSSTSGTALADAAFATFTSEGDCNGSSTGAALAAVGDLDGGGRADLIIGAPNHKHDGNCSDHFGRAYVVFGEDLGSGGTFSLTVARTTILACFGNSVGLLGSAFGGGGDVTGDGVPDVLIGAPGIAPGGRAYLYSGAALAGGGYFGCGAQHWTFEGHNGANGVGSTLAMVGDVDGDGLEDLAVGAAYSGWVGLFLGFSTLGLPAGTTLSIDDWDVRLASPQYGRHYAVAGRGDYDGDLLDDLIVGDAYTEDGRGYVVPGASITSLGSYNLETMAAVRMRGAGYDSGVNRTGHHVAWIGDQDGDGRDEALAVSIQSDLAAQDSGAVSVFRSGSSLVGDPAMTEADVTFAGGDQAQLGYAMDAGDLNDDGIDDIVLRARGAGRAIHVFLGR